MSAPHEALAAYETRVQTARAALAASPAVKALIDGDVDPQSMLAFLVVYSIRGVAMTQPVEGWIYRAGVRCEEAGELEIGRILKGHSKQEANHHQWLIEDAQRLAGRFAARFGRSIDVDAVAQHEPYPATQAYIALHEDTIGGPTPWGQVAIELEIEGLSGALGPRLLGSATRLLGRDVLESLVFLREHVSTDVGHTELNRRLMAMLLKASPGRAADLAAIGSRALRIYGEFIASCAEEATSLLRVD